MENASKALFIAVGVILGVLLLSLMVYVFGQGARVNEAYDQKQITNQLELYNSKFEQYDRDNNNIMDVISLCNLAYDVNSACEFDPTLSVEINIKIGNKTYALPKEANEKLKRNIIMDGNSPINIYDLANIFINSDTAEKKLGITTGLDNVVIDQDKLSTTALKDNQTIYKYLFKVDRDNGGFEYYEQNMKVSSVTLKAYLNPQWTE